VLSDYITLGGVGGVSGHYVALSTAFHAWNTSIVPKKYWELIVRIEFSKVNSLSVGKVTMLLGSDMSILDGRFASN